MAGMSRGTRVLMVVVGSVVGGMVLLCGLVGVVAAVVGGEDQGGRDASGPVVTETVTESATPEPSATPASETSEPAPTEEPEPTYVVTNVVDGDTVDLDNGESVRLVGIDTPERGACGHERAAAALSRMVLGRKVRLVDSDEDRDKYDRLLRFLEVGSLDPGLRLLRKGLAVARYDSRDGYGRHPREDAYVAADEAAPDVSCPKPKPEPRGFADTDDEDGGGGSCAPGYDPCVPMYPPDLDCADVGPVTVTGSDPHGLDRDGDGRACGGD